MGRPDSAADTAATGPAAAATVRTQAGEGVGACGRPLVFDRETGGWQPLTVQAAVPGGGRARPCTRCRLDCPGRAAGGTEPAG